MHCPVTGINIPRMLITAIAGFGFIFLFEYVLHHQFLMETYKATPDLWRAPETMGEFFPWLVLLQFMFVAAIVKIFALFVNSSNLKKATMFGLMIGGLVAIVVFSFWVFMPISLELAGWWAVGAIVEGTVLGLLCGLIYKDNTKVK